MGGARDAAVDERWGRVEAMAADLLPVSNCNYRMRVWGAMGAHVVGAKSGCCMGGGAAECGEQAGLGDTRRGGRAWSLVQFWIAARWIVWVQQSKTQRQKGDGLGRGRRQRWAVLWCGVLPGRGGGGGAAAAAAAVMVSRYTKRNMNMDLERASE